MTITGKGTKKEKKIGKGKEMEGREIEMGKGINMINIMTNKGTFMTGMEIEIIIEIDLIDLANKDMMINDKIDL